MIYRIFSNDRGKVRGVPMFSALCPVTASTAADAERVAKRDYPGVRLKAVEWPMTSQASKDWYLKHVGVTCSAISEQPGRY